jgi:hypothetical protein
MICYGPTVIQASALAYSLGQYPTYFCRFYLYSTYTRSGSFYKEHFEKITQTKEVNFSH